ncbi:hypothetical protein N431DRAFT_469196 [Stipitochalara longipes BDJ]|nr:hypothetical protein N431DRAFT_469196 [Stipitochalara longipes BDJ]
MASDTGKTLDDAESSTSKHLSLSSSSRGEPDEISYSPSQRMKEGLVAFPKPEVDTAREEQLSKIAQTMDFSQNSGSRPIIEEQTPREIVKTVSFSQDAITPLALEDPVSFKISDGVTAVESGISETNGKANYAKLFEFEMHYDLHSQTFTHVVFEILSDQSTYKHIHNWDEKLFKGPLKAILKDLHRSWGENACTQASLIAYSTIEEVELTSNADSSNAVISVEPLDTVTDVTKYLFFTKKPSSKGSSPLATLKTAKLRADKMRREPPSIEVAHLLSPAQGRIIHVKDHISYLERITLLFVYLFCARLQNEDYGFARGFIERHLGLKCEFKLPYHWQEKSPPEIDSSRQKCYKRVTISCHITYLTLSLDGEKENTEDQLDRVRIFPFHLRKSSAESGEISLLKASCSVLLTLCIPEESESCEEEISLLRTPRALWTLLIISCSANFASDHQTREYLTPIAQYVRGITASLYTQRKNAESIYEDTKNAFRDHSSESIFDDENFTKSTSYHWAVRTCDELNESIASTLRFVRARLESQLDKLCHEAHAYEELGIQYWLQQMKEEIFALEDLQAQILALRGQVQESRNALHGVTSILETRTALQQGERMKTLAYLATIYLPLSATSSIYSMGVLPKSASFLSFFIVFAILFLLTMLLGINLKKIAQKLKSRTFAPESSPVSVYIKLYMDLLNPYNKPEKISSAHFYRLPELDYWLYLLARWFINGLPIVLLRNLVLPEICMPIDQYIMYQHRNNPYVDIKYHWVFFIKDVIRGILIPAWIAVAIGVLGYLLILDILYGSLLLIIGLFQWLFCRK